MAKCKICANKIEQLFLQKIKGTYIKDRDGKQQVVCNECQRKYKTKEEIIEKL